MVKPTKPRALRTMAGAPINAIGIASVARPPMTIASAKVRPSPSLRAAHDASNAPTSQPTLLIAKITPTTAAVRWRSRYANTRKTAPKIMFEPRLVVAVHPAIRHRMGLLKTTSIPSRISGMKPVAPDAVLGRDSGSGVVIEARATADARKERASTATALAPPIHWINKPATAGPTICDAERVTSSFVLPSIRLARSTKAGRYD